MRVLRECTRCNAEVQNVFSFFFFFPLFLLVRQVNTCWRITSEKRVLYTLIKIYGFMSGSLLNHSNIYFHLHV